MSVHDGHRDRMRKRFLKEGLSGFAEHEALELLLYYAIPQGDVNPLAHALMEEFGSLMGVFSAPVERLIQIKGVKERTAVLLHLTPLIVQKARLEQAEQELVSLERNEAVYEICLDRKGRLLDCKRLGEGSASAVNLDVRKLVENALLSGASSVVLAHNHPSGIALPSHDDHATTQRAREALASVKICLEDHIIVADGDYVSFSQSGYFD